MDDRGGRNTWAVLIPAERYAAERLFHHDTLPLPEWEEPAIGPRQRVRPAAGDEVLVAVDGDSPKVVGLGRIRPVAGDGHDPDDPFSEDGATPFVVTYTRRAFDEPVPAGQLTFDGPITRIDPALYRELAARLGPTVDRRTWMVSLDLPIEAPTPAEAVRLFWSYVLELGPRELPAFVSPLGNELAMQAFVLGEEANQDPEEDD